MATNQYTLQLGQLENWPLNRLEPCDGKLSRTVLRGALGWQQLGPTRCRRTRASMANIEEFVSAAREFSDWCLSAPVDEAEEARRALAHLLRLYSLAFEFRFPKDMDYELDGERIDNATWEKVFKRARALPFNDYSSIFDPQVVPPEEPVVGYLADDIADIHRDLSEGLCLYGEGHVAEAAWTFLHSFQSHWGRHASSAIRALHCWLADTGSW